MRLFFALSGIGVWKRARFLFHTHLPTALLHVIIATPIFLNTNNVRKNLSKLNFTYFENP